MIPKNVLSVFFALGALFLLNQSVRSNDQFQEHACFRVTRDCIVSENGRTHYFCRGMNVLGYRVGKDHIRVRFLDHGEPRVARLSLNDVRPLLPLRLPGNSEIEPELWHGVREFESIAERVKSVLARQIDASQTDSDVERAKFLVLLVASKAELSDSQWLSALNGIDFLKLSEDLTTVSSPTTTRNDTRSPALPSSKKEDFLEALYELSLLKPSIVKQYASTLKLEKTDLESLVYILDIDPNSVKAVERFLDFAHDDSNLIDILPFVCSHLPYWPSSSLLAKALIERLEHFAKDNSLVLSTCLLRFDQGGLMNSNDDLGEFIRERFVLLPIKSALTSKSRDRVVSAATCFFNANVSLAGSDEFGLHDLVCKEIDEAINACDLERYIFLSRAIQDASTESGIDYVLSCLFSDCDEDRALSTEYLRDCLPSLNVSQLERLVDSDRVSNRVLACRLLTKALSTDRQQVVAIANRLVDDYDSRISASVLRHGWLHVQAKNEGPFYLVPTEKIDAKAKHGTLVEQLEAIPHVRSGRILGDSLRSDSVELKHAAIIASSFLSTNERNFVVDDLYRLGESTVDPDIRIATIVSLSNIDLVGMRVDWLSKLSIDERTSVQLTLVGCLGKLLEQSSLPVAKKARCRSMLEKFAKNKDADVASVAISTLYSSDCFTKTSLDSERDQLVKRIQSKIEGQARISDWLFLLLYDQGRITDREVSEISPHLSQEQAIYLLDRVEQIADSSDSKLRKLACDLVWKMFAVNGVGASREPAFPLPLPHPTHFLDINQCFQSIDQMTTVNDIVDLLSEKLNANKEPIREFFDGKVYGLMTSVQVIDNSGRPVYPSANPESYFSITSIISACYYGSPRHSRALIFIFTDKKDLQLIGNEFGSADYLENLFLGAPNIVNEQRKKEILACKLLGGNVQGRCLVYEFGQATMGKRVRLAKYQLNSGVNVVGNEELINSNLSVLHHLESIGVDTGLKRGD